MTSTEAYDSDCLPDTTTRGNASVWSLSHDDPCGSDEARDHDEATCSKRRRVLTLPPIDELLPQYFDGQDEYNRAEALKLLKQKEIATEALIKDILDHLVIPEHASVNEMSRLLKEETKRKVTAMSATLAHKVAPLIELLSNQKIGQLMSQSFAQVEPLNVDALKMTENYRTCFNTFVNAEDAVSFRTANTILTGGVDVRDLYILTFFSMATCRRTKGDNILQLGLVGASTTGKSTLFESILLEGSHVTTNEAGCGRFQVGNKPVLLFHDVAIRDIACGKDSEKIKALARTEPAATKIHSTILNLPSLFIFYTSNERMMDHAFKLTRPLGPMQPADKNQSVLVRSPVTLKMSFKKPLLMAPLTRKIIRCANDEKWELYESEVNQPGKRSISAEMLNAVQSRFIEAHVRKPPPINVECMPKYGNFVRMHGILGIYKRVIDILEHYNKPDFASPMLIKYVLSGLSNNFSSYASMFPQQSEGVSRSLRELIEKYASDQPASCENYLNQEQL